MAQRWTREHQREHGKATQGRSSEFAAWHQSILDEAASGEGKQSAAIFFDLMKACGQVKLEDMWAAGKHFEFPLPVLRLVLEAFSFARRLSYKGAAAEPVHTLTATLAGGGFAQLSFLLVLIRPIDRLVAHFRGRPVTFCIYVDDIAVHSTGTVGQVRSALSTAAGMIVDSQEGGLEMRDSWRDQWAPTGVGKTIATASTQPSPTPFPPP